MIRPSIPRLAALGLIATGLGLLLAGPFATRPSPAHALTRAQLAVLYPHLAAVQFQPPACVAGEEMFDDVPATSPFCPWIEELARRGITGGCAPDRYCPGNAVTRAQMAVFVVRSMEACPTLDPSDEMIRVGGVCIDKYEASVWSQPDGGIQYGVVWDDYPCSDNGQDCDDVYARSVPDVTPSRFISWFQAQAALANSGKRLPTSAEWQMAVLGTPDPGDTPGSEDCNTVSGGPETTGERENCVSRWGHHDMVGNVWEWVADRDEVAAGCQVWSTVFGEDLSCIGRMDGDADYHLPGALHRGGIWNSGTSAGPFAARGSSLPSNAGDSFGFRGAR